MGRLLTAIIRCRMTMYMSTVAWSILLPLSNEMVDYVRGPGILDCPRTKAASR